MGACELFEPEGEVCSTWRCSVASAAGLLGRRQLGVWWQRGGCEVLDLLLPELLDAVVFEGRLLEGDEVSVGQSWRRCKVAGVGIDDV